MIKFKRSGLKQYLPKNRPNGDITSAKNAAKCVRVRVVNFPIPTTTGNLKGFSNKI